MERTRKNLPRRRAVGMALLALAALFTTVGCEARGTQAKRQRVHADILAIREAIRQSTLVNGNYPKTLTQLTEPDKRGKTYLAGHSVIVDPWGNTYEYAPPSGGTPYRIWSFGRDGQKGGDGLDADVDPN